MVRSFSARRLTGACVRSFSQGAQDWSTALYKALEHAQRTLQTKIEELHVQRSRLGAHDDLIEVTKKNVQEESNQLQTELKAKIGEV